MSTTRRTPGVFSAKPPRGPNGENLCYNCHGPMPRTRAYNCSAECSLKWRMRTSPAAMRAEVLKRDAGVCAHCGLDTVQLWAALRWVRGKVLNGEFYDFKAVLGKIVARWPEDLWDADHIQPVVEGGGECDLSNLRTLCLPCHAEETRKLAARRAADRHMNKIEERDNGRGLLAGVGVIQV